MRTVFTSYAGGVSVLLEILTEIEFSRCCLQVMSAQDSSHLPAQRMLLNACTYHVPPIFYRLPFRGWLNVRRWLLFVIRFVSFGDCLKLIVNIIFLSLKVSLTGLDVPFLVLRPLPPLPYFQCLHYVPHHQFQAASRQPSDIDSQYWAPE